MNNNKINAEDKKKFVKKYIGRVRNFYKAVNVAEILLDEGSLKLGDKIVIEGTTTKAFEHKVDSILLEDKKVAKADKNKDITLKINSLARKNDKVYLLTEKEPEKINVLLYYKYVHVPDPKKFCEEHLALCKNLELKGRIYVAEEGINGTVSGTEDAITKYKQAMWNNLLFKDIEFKESVAPEHPFEKIFVRVRKEIVVLNVPGVDPSKSGKKLSADDFKHILDNFDPEKYVIIDARNNYEAKIGKFKHALTLDIQNFRDFPQAAEELEKYKDKKVITYCTGGIRCEKASAFLLKHGFKDVYQIDGGIVKFGKTYPIGYFEGLCYVFDDRRAIPLGDASNVENVEIISSCEICVAESNQMINCSNSMCNKQFVCCNSCKKKLDSFCSEVCRSKVLFTKESKTNSHLNNKTKNYGYTKDSYKENENSRKENKRQILYQSIEVQ